MSMSSAFVTRVNGEFRRCLSEGLGFIGWNDFVKRDSVVFVKPNFTFPRHREGVTTSPELLERLLEIVRRRSSRVMVGESDGGNHSFKAEEAFGGHRMFEICERLGVELVSLSSVPSKFVESEIQSKKVRVKLPKMLLDEVDCFISVPVLKVHVMTGVSLGLKNLWGCYPDTMRCLYHQDLDRKLALIAKLLDPKITLVDGLFALDGHGPMFGEPRRTDLILTSNNVVVADGLGARIMGVPLERARHILVAERAGLGTTDVERVRVNTDWTAFRNQFVIRKTLIDMASVPLFRSHLLSRFVMDSPFTSFVYGVAGRLRSVEEKALVNELSAYRYHA